MLPITPDRTKGQTGLRELDSTLQADGEKQVSAEQLVNSIRQLEVGFEQAARETNEEEEEQRIKKVFAKGERINDVG